MESTGSRNRIQVSNETADLLKAAGKGYWVSPRKEKVKAKGKGVVETFWLDIKKQSSKSETSSKSQTSESNGSLEFDMAHLKASSHTKHGLELDASLPANVQRRVQWMADVLLRLLKQVVARRNAVQKIAQEEGALAIDPPRDEGCPTSELINGKTVMDEVVEIIKLPNYNAKAAREEEDPSTVELPPEVVKQLYMYVTVIAGLYHHDNPFHNFDHASHVTMSVSLSIGVEIALTCAAPSDDLHLTQPFFF